MFIVRKNHKHIRLAERQLRNALKGAVVSGDLLHQAYLLGEKLTKQHLYLFLFYCQRT